MRKSGDALKSALQRIQAEFPGVIRQIRGLGFMLGLELVPGQKKLTGDPSKTQSIRFVNLLHSLGMLAIPAGAEVIRLLPPLNLSSTEIEEALKILRSAASKLAG